MAEPLYGSMSQIWPSIPTPVYGYMQQPSMAQAGRLFGSMPLSVPMQTSPLGSGIPAGSPTPGSAEAYGGVTPTFANPAFFGGLATPIAALPFAGPEIPIGVTATALLATVAMRRGQPLGPANDQEIEDFIYDALELVPGANDIEVRCEGGRATLTGVVPHKRLKRDAGEIAWAIPSVNDVLNNVTIAARRRSRAGRENETPAAISSRKQA
jgi:BON domain